MKFKYMVSFENFISQRDFSLNSLILNIERFFLIIEKTSLILSAKQTHAK